MDARIRTFRFAAAACCAALLTSEPAAQESRAAADGSAATRPYPPRLIDVRVVDENGDPIPDALVTMPPRWAHEFRKPTGLFGALDEALDSGRARTRADGTLYVRGTGIRLIGVEAEGRAPLVGRLDFDVAKEGATSRFTLGRCATLSWEPVRWGTGGAGNFVRFVRADGIADPGAITHSESVSLRESDRNGGAPIGPNHQWRGAALGVPYRAILHDRYGPVPGCAVDVAPLFAGEDRRVTVPMPEKLGDLRVRVLSVDGRPTSVRGVGVQPVSTSGNHPYPDAPFGWYRVPVSVDGLLMLHDLRVEPFDVWVLDADAGWGAIRTTPTPSGAGKVDDLRLRPTRRIRLRLTTKFGPLDAWILSVVVADGVPVPWASATFDDPQNSVRRDAVLCPSEAVTVRARAKGKDVVVRIPEGAPFGREERVEAVPGVGELVVRRAKGRKPKPFELRPVRVDGVEDTSPQLVDPDFISPSQPEAADRSSAEVRLPLWPGVWSVRIGKAAPIEVEIKADESATVVLP